MQRDDARNGLPPVRRGPPGAAAFVPFRALGGLVLGAIALSRQAHDDAVVERRSDFELGVVGGTLGAPGLEHPPEGRPARVGDA